MVNPNSSNDVARHIGNATGKRGFLKWVEAVFPRDVAQRVLQHATVVTGTGLRKPGFAGLGRFGVVDRYGRITRRLGTLGDSVTVPDPNVMIQDVSFDPNAVPAVTADTTGVDNSAASPSWTSSIANALTTAVQTAGQVYATVTQTQAQQQILQTNLQRAAQGLPPLPYTAAQLGVQGPTVNFGLSSSTLTPILLVAGGIAVLAMLAGGRRKAR